MAHAHRRELIGPSPFETPRQPTSIALASGDEPPTMSPALELQKALDEIFSPQTAIRIDYGRGVMLTALASLTVAACGAFWWSALMWAISLTA